MYNGSSFFILLDWFHTESCEQSFTMKWKSQAHPQNFISMWCLQTTNFVTITQLFYIWEHKISWLKELKTPTSYHHALGTQNFLLWEIIRIVTAMTARVIWWDQIIRYKSMASVLHANTSSGIKHSKADHNPQDNRFCLNANIWQYSSLLSSTVLGRI